MILKSGMFLFYYGNSLLPHKKIKGVVEQNKGNDQLFEAKLPSEHLKISIFLKKTETDM